MLRIGPAYYYHLDFDDFVKHEAQLTRTQAELKRALLNKAEMCLIPLKETDIKITKTGQLLLRNVASTFDAYLKQTRPTSHAPSL